MNQQSEKTVTAIPTTSVTYPPTNVSSYFIHMIYSLFNIFRFPMVTIHQINIQLNQSHIQIQLKRIIKVLLKVLMLEIRSDALYFRDFLVDTNVHYSSQVQPYYFQAPQQQQPPQPYYPTDSQQPELMNYPPQWSQQPTQPDLLNVSSQAASINSPYYQPPGDQSSYIQPGFTSTPNSYSSQQPSQPWYPPGQTDQRDRLPSNEVCRKKLNSISKKISGMKI